MKQAKASENEITAVRELLELLEENGRPVPIGWRRIVEGYDLLVKECCDPEKDYLDWKPDIQKAIGQYNGKVDAESDLRDAANEFLDGMSRS